MKIRPDMSKSLRCDILLGPAQDIAQNGVSDLRILETQSGSTCRQRITNLSPRPVQGVSKHWNPEKNALQSNICSISNFNFEIAFSLIMKEILIANNKVTQKSIKYKIEITYKSQGETI